MSCADQVLEAERGGTVEHQHSQVPQAESEVLEVRCEEEGAATREAETETLRSFLKIHGFAHVWKVNGWRYHVVEDRTEIVRLLNAANSLAKSTWGSLWGAMSPGSTT